VTVLTLSKTQLHEVIFSNRYKLDNESTPSIFNESMLLNKTAEEYGFEVVKEKAEKICKEIFKEQNSLSKLKEKYDGAVLQIKGDYSIKPEFSMKTKEGFVAGELFVFHETVTNNNHKILAKKLIEKKAVELFPGCDEEYLYQAISEVTETQFYETLRKVATELPIFHVSFDTDGTFSIKEMGSIT